MTGVPKRVALAQFDTPPILPSGWGWGGDGGGPGNLVSNSKFCGAFWLVLRVVGPCPRRLGAGWGLGLAERIWGGWSGKFSFQYSKFLGLGVASSRGTGEGSN